jgi:hypothetical protein
MKLQVDVTVEDTTEALVALQDLQAMIEDGMTRGQVFANDDVVGRFELLQPQENASAC